MCHDSVLRFIATAVTRDDIAGKTVAEAGSYNVNGTPRDHVMPLGPVSYLGIDIRPGPGVDVVADAADLPSYGQFGAVISTECLEHAADWQAAVRGLVNATEPGGVLVITTRSAGFPWHDHPGDHWRYSVENMRAIIAGAGLDIERLEPDVPGMPGVLVKARKPAGWAWPDDDGWAGITLDPPG